jgi:hypothetical protein
MTKEIKTENIGGKTPKKSSNKNFKKNISKYQSIRKDLFNDFTDADFDFLKNFSSTTIASVDSITLTFSLTLNFNNPK